MSLTLALLSKTPASSAFRQYYETECSKDDLVFLVQASSTEVDVLRRGSSRLEECMSSQFYDWTRTLRMNVALHEFDFVIACGVCERDTNGDMHLVSKISQAVSSFPHKSADSVFWSPIHFVSNDPDDGRVGCIRMSKGQVLAVELVGLASDGACFPLFLGSVNHDKVALASSSATAQRPSSLYAGRVPVGQQLPRIIRMRGPEGRGVAELAIFGEERRRSSLAQMFNRLDSVNVAACKIVSVSIATDAVIEAFLNARGRSVLYENPGDLVLRSCTPE
uniref:Uncharacterized protein n=1 Tax=Fundulus heteroclitus TaxID=8078 RepID=A0A146Q1Z3_FUNHE